MSLRRQSSQCSQSLQPVCVKLTIKFIFELASVAFLRRRAWGHGVHTSSGVAGMQGFDDDDQEPFCHEEEWEADEDVDEM